VDEVQAPRLPV